ncbi:MAG: T9SS type A sorting domain-containing protein, partial [Cryomorphaceae bacterium]
LTIWTENPNGGTDSLPQNDTASMVLATGLSGTYNVPNDFADLDEATTALNTFGVCDDVVIELSSGTYNEQVVLAEVLGVNEDATVTFTSATGNSNDASIVYASTGSADNYVVYLNGADWISFRDLTIRNNATYLYGTAVRIENGAEHATFDGCHIRAGDYPYTGNLLSAVYASGVNHNLTLTNNMIEKGGYGIYLWGSSTTNQVEDVVIENNHMHDAYYYGIYGYYIDGFEFNNNTIDNDSNLYLYGPRAAMLYYTDNFNINGNYIGSDVSNGSYGGYGYGLYMYYCLGSSNPKSSISNNCINVGAEGTTSYGYYGTYMSQCGNLDFHNNSVTRRGGNNGYYTLYIASGGAITVKNNSLADYYNGYPMFVSGPWTLNESDNNNFYTTGGNTVYFNNTAYSSVQAYYDATGYDMHSISTDPAYVDTLACVTCNDTLDNAGTNTTIAMYDIDSNMRSATTPDIGAVEWVSPSSFTLGGDSTYCADEVTLEAGPAQSITWSVNGNSSSAPTITLTGGSEATTYNVLVSIQTQYCGSASDNALITLVPNANLDSSTHICADANVTLNPGGLSSGTYTWSTGAATQSIVVDAPGVYTVTKDVMGCVSTASTAVTQSEAVEIIGTEVCSDDLPLSLDATIANGTTYAWSGGSAPTSSVNTFNDAGAYTVTATDAYGCTSVDSFEVVILEEPEAVISIISTSGTIYIFDASSSPFLTSSSSVNWNFGAGAVPATSTNVLETVTYPWGNPSNPPSYSVSLEINNGCGVDITTKIVSPNPTSVEELAAGEFAIFPNPANDVVTIATKDVDAGNILILDMSGRTVAQAPMSAGSNNHEINVSGLAAGAYVVKVVTDANSQMKQLIVQ